MAVGSGLLDRPGDAEVVHVPQAHHLLVDVDGRQRHVTLLEFRHDLGELLPHLRARQIVVAYLDAVSVLPGQVPGDNLRNLLLRLRRSSTAIAVAGAGSVVEDLDEV